MHTWVGYQAVNCFDLYREVCKSRTPHAFRRSLNPPLSMASSKFRWIREHRLSIHRSISEGTEASHTTRPPRQNDSYHRNLLSQRQSWSHLLDRKIPTRQSSRVSCSAESCSLAYWTDRLSWSRHKRWPHTASRCSASSLASSGTCCCHQAAVAWTATCRCQVQAFFVRRSRNCSFIEYSFSFKLYIC